jgi:hypothetical protein
MRTVSSPPPEVHPVTCPKCLNTSRDHAPFCASCGTLFGQPGEPASPADPDITLIDGMTLDPDVTLIDRTAPAAPGWTGGFRFAEPPGPYSLGASASQFPATPGDQYAPAEMAGQHAPAPAASAREFRLDLRRLTRAEQIAGTASMIVLSALFLPWFGFDELGTSINISGTTAHSYLMIVVITALLMTGYLLLRSGWDEFPVSLPVAPELLLLVGGGVQFVLVLVGFLDAPLSGLGWEIGAYLALIAATAAAAPLASPALHAWQTRHKPAGERAARR